MGANRRHHARALSRTTTRSSEQPFAIVISTYTIYQLSVLNTAITEFATSGGLDFEAQIAGRQSEGLATAFAPLYSWVYRRKGSTRGQFGRGGEVTVILYPVRCIARSGRRNILAMLGISMFARAVCRP